MYKSNKLVSLLLFAILTLFSCENEPYEGPIPVTGVGNNLPVLNGEFRANFDGQTFVSTSTTASKSSSNVITIKATKTNGEIFDIKIPTNEVGAYNLDSNPTNFQLSYTPASGILPFTAQSDDTGAFSDFPDYTDTSQIVITNVDLTNKKISGTFKFTGVKFANSSNTAIVTKVFTSGSFTNLTYTQ